MPNSAGLGLKTSRAHTCRAAGVGVVATRVDGPSAVGQSSASCGGPVGCRRGRGAVRRPRICLATAGEVMRASTSRLPPHGQSKTSKPQVRRKSPAQSRRGRGAECSDEPRAVAAFAQVATGAGCSAGRWGTTWARAFELGAKTPKNLVKWTLGLTITEHSRSSNCTGVSTRMVAPPGSGFLSRYSSLPSSRRESRSSASGPRAP